MIVVSHCQVNPHHSLPPVPETGYTRPPQGFITKAVNVPLPSDPAYPSLIHTSLPLPIPHLPTPPCATLPLTPYTSHTLPSDPAYPSLIHTSLPLPVTLTPDTSLCHPPSHSLHLSHPPIWPSLPLPIPHLPTPPCHTHTRHLPVPPSLSLPTPLTPSHLSQPTPPYPTPPYPSLSHTSLPLPVTLTPDTSLCHPPSHSLHLSHPPICPSLPSLAHPCPTLVPALSPRPRPRPHTTTPQHRGIFTSTDNRDLMLWPPGSRVSIRSWIYHKRDQDLGQVPHPHLLPHHPSAARVPLATDPPASTYCVLRLAFTPLVSWLSQTFTVSESRTYRPQTFTLSVWVQDVWVCGYKPIGSVLIGIIISLLRLE